MPTKKIKATIPPPLAETLVIKAESHRQKLVDLLMSSDNDFAQFERPTVHTMKRKSVYSVLGLSAEEVSTLNTKKKAVRTVAGVRNMFQKYDLQTNGPFIRLLLKGKCACVVCYGVNTDTGIMGLHSDRLTEHFRSATHEECQKKYNTAKEKSKVAQMTLMDMGNYN